MSRSYKPKNSPEGENKLINDFLVQLRLVRHRVQFQLLYHTN